MYYARSTMGYSKKPTSQANGFSSTDKTHANKINQINQKPKTKTNELIYAALSNSKPKCKITKSHNGRLAAGGASTKKIGAVFSVWHPCIHLLVPAGWLTGITGSSEPVGPAIHGISKTSQDVDSKTHTPLQKKTHSQNLTGLNPLAHWLTGSLAH